MVQKELMTKRDIISIGAEIGYEMGKKMVNDFQVANPTAVQGYFIGRNIIDQILAQPGCVGIQFLKATNKQGQETIVYVGVDAAGKSIVSYPTVNGMGQLEQEKGIVADYVIIRTPTKPSSPTTPGGDEYGIEWGF